MGVSLHSFGWQNMRADDPSSEHSTASSRDAGFRAVSSGPELANGTVLLVEAYAAIWVLVVAFIAMTWRRMTRLEAKLAAVASSVAARDRDHSEGAATSAAAAVGERRGNSE